MKFIWLKLKIDYTLEEKGIFLHCWWECKLVQPLYRTVWRFLKKLKIELPYDLAIPPLGMHPEKTLIWKDACTPVFIATPFTTAKTWEQPQCPLKDEWMKMWDACLCVCVPHMMCIYTHNGMLLSHKKEQNNVICSNMVDLEIIILSEESQRNINIWYYLYVESKNRYRWTFIYKQKYIHRYRKQTYGYQRG